MSAAGLTTAAAVLLGTSVLAQAATPGWRQVYSHHYGAAANISEYGATVAFSTGNAWVFGGTNEGFGYAPTGAPVAVHWNGKAWSGYRMPSQATGYIAAAGATSPKNVWAVTNFSAYVLHWNGVRWSLAKHLPVNGGEVTGVIAVTPTDVWVVGGGGVIGGIGTWNYNGKTWQQWKGSALGIERGSAISPSDIWAIGGPLAPDSAIEHFNGKAWQFVTPKAWSGFSFGDIAAFSNKNVWVGNVANPRTHVVSLMHYNGKTWTSVKPPWPVVLSLPVPDGHGGLWFTGYTDTGQRYLVHRSATGKWGRSAIPVSVPGLITVIAGTASVLASGAKAAGPGTSAAIWADGQV